MIYITPASKNTVHPWKMKAWDGFIRTRVCSPQKLGCKNRSTGLDFFGWRWGFSQFSHRSSKVFVLLPKGKIIKSDLPAKRPVVLWRAPETLAAGVEITRRTPASRTSPWSDSAELGKALSPAADGPPCQGLRGRYAAHGTSRDLN